MNEYSLKITGSAALPEQLDATKSLTITAKLDIYEVAKRDNQDSTFTIVYKAKITSEVSVQQSDKVIYHKDTSRASQRLRLAITAYALEQKIEDTESFYQSTVETLIEKFKS